MNQQDFFSVIKGLDPSNSFDYQTLTSGLKKAFGQGQEKLIDDIIDILVFEFDISSDFELFELSKCKLEEVYKGIISILRRNDV